MERRTQMAAVGAAAVVVLGLGTSAVVASGGGEDEGADTPITGPALAQAEQAALDAVGEGTVTETEVDDEESKYEVEITRDDGSEVDVQLDEDFAVVGQEGEDGEENDD